MRELVKSHYKSFGKFTVVGALNTVIDFAVFYVLYEIFELWFVFAHILAFFVALTNSFVFNSLWTFKNLKRDKLLRQVSSFVVVGLIGLLFSTVTLFIAELFVHVYVAKVFAMAASFLWNYTGSSIFVFKDKD